ncbi:MAG: hypothetical protein GX061_02280 [Eubacteriaceae bacterium]|nr:hypothetical protein [Eubacteriaceae bacterium]
MAQCKWKNGKCGQCADTDPFTTHNYCHIAVKLYLADNNIPCPTCKDKYLKLNEGHYYECPSCNYNIYFEDILG